MMWAELVARMCDMIENNALILAALGGMGRVRKASPTDKLQVPGIEYHLISDVENELWAPCIFQFDVWHHSSVSVRMIELTLRGMFHADLPIDFGDGVQAWSQYSDGAELATPDRYNFTGRALRFTVTPLRRRYAGIDS